MSFHIGNEAYELGIHIMQKYPLSSVLSDVFGAKALKIFASLVASYVNTMRYSFSAIKTCFMGYDRQFISHGLVINFSK